VPAPFYGCSKDCKGFRPLHSGLPVSKDQLACASRERVLQVYTGRMSQTSDRLSLGAYQLVCSAASTALSAKRTPPPGTSTEDCEDRRGEDFSVKGGLHIAQQLPDPLWGIRYAVRRAARERTYRFISYSHDSKEHKT
jgi:hypothetical protein